jgi:hypothetical protein
MLLSRNLQLDQGNIYKKASTYLIKMSENAKSGMVYGGKGKGFLWIDPA